MICFYCCAHLTGEHVCQELAATRHERGLLHGSDIVLYWKEKVRQLAQGNETKGSWQER